MTDRLSLYNGALTRHIGVEKLASLSENRPVRYALDDVWDNGVVDDCLQAGQWDFAGRSQKLEYEPAITPAFGYTYAFERPTDLKRVMAVCSDEFFQIPLTDYLYEGGYWYANLESLYVRYVSNDASFGGDYSMWPPNFTRYVECYLAEQSARRAGLDERAKTTLTARCKMLLSEAKATDAMENPSTLPPLGSWTLSRGTRSRERGKRTRLIG